MTVLTISMAGDSHKLTALASSALLLAGGAGLVFYFGYARAKDVTRRVGMVRAGADPGYATKSAAAGSQDFQFTEDYLGLSVPEQEQIARIFGGYGVAPAKALFCFRVMRLISAVLGAALTYWAGIGLMPPLPYTLPAIAAICGWYLAVFPVRSGTAKRLKSVSTGLPDALELLAVCADAGMSLESALYRVAGQLRDSQPALAAELSLTWAQITIFPNRDQAFTNLAERIGLPSLRIVASTLSQSMKYGTPLAQSLRTAASELRNIRLSQMEERAHRLPVLLTLPMMLLIMPVTFLLICGPAAIRILDIFAQQQ
jgi:tight adherence protein C